MTVGSELVTTFQSRELGDLVTDLGEAGLDAFIDSDAIKDIPVLGSILRMGAVVGSFRDHMLAKKVARFLREIASLTESERVKVMNEIATGEEEREHVGEVIIDLIDKTDAVDKPVLIGRLFTAAGRSEIPASDVMRLAAIITRVYIDHLRLLGDPEINEVTPSTKSILYANGLMSLTVRAERSDALPGGPVSMGALSGALARNFLVEYELSEDAKTIARVCFRASM